MALNNVLGRELHCVRKKLNSQWAPFCDFCLDELAKYESEEITAENCLRNIQEKLTSNSISIPVITSAIPEVRARPQAPSKTQPRTTCDQVCNSLKTLLDYLRGLPAKNLELKIQLPIDERQTQNRDRLEK